MSNIDDTLGRYYDREMNARAVRPLGGHRETRLAEFVNLCAQQALSSVIEVGCGAGRDGTVLHSSGLEYTGLDFSSSSGWHGDHGEYSQADESPVETGMPSTC